MWPVPCSVQRRCRPSSSDPLHRALDQAPLDEPLGQHPLRGVVEVAVLGARLDRRDAGLLRLVHRVVDLALELAEACR